MSNIYRPVGNNRNNNNNNPAGNSDPDKVQFLGMTFNFPGFKPKSFIFIISVIEILMFAVQRFYGWYIGDDNCATWKLGCKFTPSEVVYHEYWRLLTPIFLHGGVLHLGMNMLF
mmetsp:Transcript_34968/g.31514  ORF Transcript_34968/g.31514 Transcript_34968/m.31514 type:complete len:114 (+) Transcript_34968:99-440(+)